MKTKNEVLWVGPPARTIERVVVPGSRLPADDPFVLEYPERVSAAPATDGTHVAVQAVLSRQLGLVRLGQLLSDEDAALLGDTLVVPGPVNQDHLLSLGEASVYNRPDNVARRKHERTVGLARRRERSEKAAAEATAEAEAAQERADELRATARKHGAAASS